MFAADSGDVHIEKRYRADQARYRLQLDVVVTNRGDAPVEQHLVLAVTGRQDPDKKGGGFFVWRRRPTSRRRSATRTATSSRNAIEKLDKDPIKVDKRARSRWIATDEKFFLLAAVPYPESPAAHARLPGGSLGTDVGRGDAGVRGADACGRKARSPTRSRLRGPEGHRTTSKR